MESLWDFLPVELQGEVFRQEHQIGMRECLKELLANQNKIEQLKLSKKWRKKIASFLFQEASMIMFRNTLVVYNYGDSGGTTKTLHSSGFSDRDNKLARRIYSRRDIEKNYEFQKQDRSTDPFYAEKQHAKRAAILEAAREKRYEQWCKEREAQWAREQALEQERREQQKQRLFIKKLELCGELLQDGWVEVSWSKQLERRGDYFLVTGAFQGDSPRFFIRPK